MNVKELKKRLDSAISAGIGIGISWKEAQEIIQLQARAEEYHNQYHLCEAKLLSHKSIIIQLQARIKELEGWLREIRKSQEIMEARRFAGEALKGGE